MRVAARIIGVFVGGMALALLLGTAAWAQSPSPTVAAAPTTSTDATATTAATGTSGAATTATPQAPAATSGLLPPVIGLTPLNPAWKVNQMVVQVWPEYDQEAVLVIMNFDLPAEVPLPATLKFAIPSGASIAGIGEVDSSGNFTFNYANSYPPVEPGTDWDIATIQVQKYRTLQIDYYYDPGLPTGAGPRSFPVLLQLPLDATSLNLHVQQPSRATDFKIQPDMQATGAGPGWLHVRDSDVLRRDGRHHAGVCRLLQQARWRPIHDQPVRFRAAEHEQSVLAAILVIVVCVGGLVVYRLYRRAAKPGPVKGTHGARRISPAKRHHPRLPRGSRLLLRWRVSRQIRVHQMPRQ